MHAKFLLFLTLIFVGTCTGHAGYAQRVKPQLYSDSSVIRAPLASVFSRNDSQAALEEIMDMRSQIQQTGCRQVGIVGNHGGTNFHEQPDNCGAIVKRIKIRFGIRVYGIQIIYQLSNGQDHTGGVYGGTWGTLYTVNIDVDEGERIIGMYGRYDSNAINLLGFFTSKGKHYGPFGGCTGEYMNVWSCNLHGITGTYSNKLNSIGFYCTDV